MTMANRNKAWLEAHIVTLERALETSREQAVAERNKRQDLEDYLDNDESPALIKAEKYTEWLEGELRAVTGSASEVVERIKADSFPAFPPQDVWDLEAALSDPEDYNPAIQARIDALVNPKETRRPT